jgi:hypothetical protein
MLIKEKTIQDDLTCLKNVNLKLTLDKGFNFDKIKKSKATDRIL